MVLNVDEFGIDSNFSLQCHAEKIIEKNGVECSVFDFTYNKKKKAESRKITITFSFPVLDICGRWHPACASDRALKPDWFPGTESMASISAPIICFFNGKSENKHTIALSEIKQRVIMQYGIHEEDGTMLCKTIIELPQNSFPERYQLKIWQSKVCEPYWKIIADVSHWWKKDLGLEFMKVPEIARDTLYSFWYSQHQNVSAKSIENESVLAAKLGFCSVIVDDGWQTDDNKRGYTFCGDWEPSPNKFPDFPAHVKKVQNMGLKYLMWFSVPFLGKKAKAWDRFKDKILCYDDFQQAAVLDLRYPEVRKYLKSIYRKAATEWGIDGFKLDFIDEFYFRPESPSFKEGMDCVDIQDALDVFLTEIMQELQNINPEIMIEFRQRYIGPQIRKYGNLLRVNDCPDSGLTNRVGTIDLRMLSGETAVHSDMLMWNKDEKPQDAALQIISSIFSTVQVSVDLEKITKDVGSMLAYWMHFMKEHVELLQLSQIQPKEPENLYPEVSVENDKIRIQVNYSRGRVVDIRTMPETCYFILGNKSDEVSFRMNETEILHYKVLDCMGKEIKTGTWEYEKWAEIEVPTAGTVVINK